MATRLSQHIAKLERIANRYDEYLYKILKSRENYVLNVPKMRLYNYGLDSNDKPIRPKYKQSTVIRKRRASKRTSHVTLRWTGAFYKSFYIEKKKSGIDFFSNDPDEDKMAKIKKIYSSNRLTGFSESDVERIDKLFLKDEINELIDLPPDLEWDF